MLSLGPLQEGSSTWRKENTQRSWGGREVGTFEEQNEGEWGQKSGQLGE